jgi:hypothetical protein
MVASVAASVLSCEAPPSVPVWVCALVDGAEGAVIAAGGCDNCNDGDIDDDVGAVARRATVGSASGR